MQKATLFKAGVGTALVAAVTLSLAVPAGADVQPNGNDAVAVGSDTVQYVADFGADGDFNSNPGYNFLNTSRRVVSFDATADASGRSGYLNGTSTPLAASIVLRAGTKPITRPNGSGAGIAALLADTNHQIDFVRSSRLPNATEEADSRATAASFGGFHVYQVATDGLQIAVDHAATDAPTNLTKAQLVNIYKGTYKVWGDVPGYSGPAPTHGIVPVIPQTGSGTRNDFLADLQAANGGTAISLGANSVVGEEHDPTGITGVTAHTDVNGNPVTNADAIEPFSTGRDKLIDTGYFGTTPAPNTIDLLGTASPSSPSYFLARTLYFIARQTLVDSTTPFQAGGSQNLVKSLFGTAGSWYAKAANAPLFTSAGVTQAWADKGNNP